MEKTRVLGISIAAAALSCGLAAPSSASVLTTAAPSANLIADSGAESASPDGSGGVVPVPHWQVPQDGQFTAVAYDTAGGFPTTGSPGPVKRGANFFAGGPSAAKSTATQSVSLKKYAGTIGKGKAKYTLSGWLGGWEAQQDHATVTVTWKDSAKKTIGKAKLKTVTAGDRGDVTGMLYRSAKGHVPKKAATARITITLTRTEGSFNDGYADNVRLVLG